MTATDPAVAAESVAPAVASFEQVVELMRRKSCDRCGAHAYVLTMHEVRQPDAEPRFCELAWCGHHFDATRTAMHAPRDFVVYDVREALIADESPAVAR